MRTRSKLAVAGLVAALLMAMAVTSASANRLSISHGNLFRIEWSSLEFAAVGIVGVRCAVTLEGSLHSTTIPKTLGLLIGYITHASVKNNLCISGSATIQQETLPWHIIYRGFRGTLPLFAGAIEGLVGAAFRVNNVFTGECMITSTTTHPVEGTAEEPTETGGGNRIFRAVSANPAAKIPCIREGRVIVEGEFRGTGSIREIPGGSVNLLVRLI